MKPRAAGQKRLIAVAFAALLGLLALLIWQGVRRGDAVRVGVPKSAAAYGAAMLLQTPSAQYACTLGSTAQALQDALTDGMLDAALLPYDLAAAAEECEIRAVLGYESLLVISRGGRLRVVEDLRGRTLTLPEALRCSRAEGMLKTLLRACKTPCALVYGEAAGAEVFCCDMDTADALLAGDAGWEIGFSLARAWRKALRTPPPAGLCLVVRQDYLARAGSDYAGFERALASAMDYGADKRKKTVAMAAAAGLARSEQAADALYDFCDFVYLTGAEMEGTFEGFQPSSS